MLDKQPLRIVLFAVVIFSFTFAAFEAQTGWSNETTHPSLYPREQCAMAYDSIQRKIVVFGGADDFNPLNETWLWDGSHKSWTRCALPPLNLVPRETSMAYDVGRGRAVLYGGYDATKKRALCDTWEWDGTVWKECKTTNSPGSLIEYAMTYDATTSVKRILIFGGLNIATTTGVRCNDTWSWDGVHWANISPSTGNPSKRENAKIAYDKIRNKVVLFGGYDGKNTLNDTWIWDGNVWSKAQPQQSPPPPRQKHAMTYDSARQKIVVYGGRNGNVLLNDTWEWDGRNWIQILPGNCPTSLENHAMAYDVINGNTVLFGGSSSSGLTNGTWAYGPTDLIASKYGISIASGGEVALALNAGSMYGNRYYFVVGSIECGRIRSTMFGSVQLQLIQDDYFWFLATNPNTLIRNSLGVLDSSGKATATIMVPSGLPSGLAGVRFYHAYVVFQSTIDYASSPVPLTLMP